MSASIAPLLFSVNSPADVRQLPRDQLKQLARELREHVLHSVAQTGGHLSSNLGTVELTIALHHVFQTPDDRIVWDVGHQTYPHKILTGRRDQMGGLRQWGGISGFPRRDESPYDAFGTAHSSTSISAALGMAVASRQLGIERHCIAVIGDGAMTAGMAFEALNNAGVSDVNLLVILNDNDMSISPPVGALNRYLAQLLSGGFYAAAKEVGSQVLRNVPPLYELAKRLEQQAKGMVLPATLFEKFGFNYVGPIDGHDLDALIPTLQNLKDRKGPQFLHVVTRKGRGYARAEQDPVTYHGPGRFDPEVGIQPAAKPAPKTFSQVFGDWLCDMAAADPKLVAITPAMREGSGMVEFHQRFPDRYFDVGIAEQHALTFAAGLACEGLKPVVAIYSTFLQRAYDQLIHDVALQSLPMVLALDRAGIVGADGPTHAGLYDVAFLRTVPKVSIACPSDERECRLLLTTAHQMDHPVAVRYPRGAGVGAASHEPLETVPVGRGVIRRRRAAASLTQAPEAGHAFASEPGATVPLSGDRSGIAILAFGTLLHVALQAAATLDATVADMRWVKPLDEDLIRDLAQTHAALVTIEEGAIMGGAGSAVLESLQAMSLQVPVLCLGVPDVFTEHGDPKVLLKHLGLDAQGVLTRIQAWFQG